MSFDLVLFGGAGDLIWRKLMPALFQAFRHGRRPARDGGGRILAVARDERSYERYRAFIGERLAEVEASKRPSDAEFARFAELLHYRRMDLSQPKDCAGLKDWIRRARCLCNVPRPRAPGPKTSGRPTPRT